MPAPLPPGVGAPLDHARSAIASANGSNSARRTVLAQVTSHTEPSALI